MKKKCFYIIFEKKENQVSYPYPPIVKESGMDYICFIDKEDMVTHSHFWQLVRIEGLQPEMIDTYLASYEETIEISQEEIIVGHVSAEKKDYVTENPSIYDISGVSFDPSAVVPTRDKHGTYIYKKNPQYTEGKYEGREFLLTIGVPVSNQIETIERCLSHIKPILEKPWAELLVVDTGSTDGTREICEKYGARIVEFPWCDNMSAARNTGIFHAKGLWYLSIDDDEWFEDVYEIIEFFESSEYASFDSATYIQRNYNTKDGRTYADYHTLRMAKITPDLHFEGRIHDALQAGGRCKQLFSYAHHYGFIKDDIVKAKAKFRRNAPLLLMDIYEYPENLRYIFQLAKELNQVERYSEAKLFFLKGVSMAEEQQDTMFQKDNAVYYLAALYNEENEQLFTMAEEFVQKYNFTAAEKAFIYYMLSSLSVKKYLRNNENYADEVIEYCESFHKYKAEYENNPTSSLLNSSVGIETVTNIPYGEDMKVWEAYARVEKAQYEQAMEIAGNINAEELMYGVDDFCRMLVCSPQNVYSILKEKMSLFLQQSFLHELSSSAAEAFMSDTNREQATENIWNLIENFSIKSLGDFAAQMLGQLDEETKLFYIKKLMDKNFDDASLVQKYFASCIMRNALTLKTEEVNHMEIFYVYVFVTGMYMDAYYHPAILEENENSVIPGYEMASYHIYKVLVAGKFTNTSVKRLRYALELFPGFKNEIQSVLKGLEG